MMESLRKIIGNNADVALVVFTLGILTVLFTPIPSQLLDFLILLNFSLALLILLLLNLLCLLL